MELCLDILEQILLFTTPEDIGTLLRTSKIVATLVKSNHFRKRYLELQDLIQNVAIAEYGVFLHLRDGTVYFEPQTCVSQAHISKIRELVSRKKYEYIQSCRDSQNLYLIDCNKVVDILHYILSENGHLEFGYFTIHKHNTIHFKHAIRLDKQKQRLFVLHSTSLIYIDTTEIIVCDNERVAEQLQPLEITCLTMNQGYLVIGTKTACHIWSYSIYGQFIEYCRLPFTYALISVAWNLIRGQKILIVLDEMKLLYMYRIEHAHATLTLQIPDVICIAFAPQESDFFAIRLDGSVSHLYISDSAQNIKKIQHKKTQRVVDMYYGCSIYIYKTANNQLIYRAPTDRFSPSKQFFIS